MEVGDVVMLKSGGPSMTVTGKSQSPMGNVDGGLVLCRCMYFVDNRFGELLVPELALEKSRTSE